MSHPLYDKGRFLSGELPVVEDAKALREIHVRWAGIQALLREPELYALEPHLTNLTNKLEQVHEIFNDMSEALDSIHVEPPEPAIKELERSAAVDLARAAVNHFWDNLVEGHKMACGPNASLALDIHGGIESKMEEAIDAAIAETEGG